MFIHIHTGWEIFYLFRHLTKLGKGICLLHLIPHGLDHPETHDIFQETNRIVISAFIGKVGLPALLIADGVIQLYPEEGPGAGTDIGKVGRFGGNCQHSRCRIVRSDHHHTAVKADFLLNLFCQAAENRPRFLERCKNLFREAEHADGQADPCWQWCIPKHASR